MLVGVALTLCHVIWVTEGHGRLADPPSRSSAWRFGFNTPVNYNDHEIYCGGFSVQWHTNKGKCGPCGDAWQLPQPRPNEGGGKYGVGVIVASFKQGQVIPISVDLTANHRGFFEFRLCPHNSPLTPASDECFDTYVLQKADGSGNRHYVSPGNGLRTMDYQLPQNVTCSQCVLQWRYVAGNNWGHCENGTGSVGCGPQEEFRACSDIAILGPDGGANAPVATVQVPVTTVTVPVKTDKTVPTVVPEEGHDKSEEDVDTETEEGGDRVPSEIYPAANPEGHVVAIVFAFLSIFLIILAFLTYFLWLQKGAKTLLKMYTEKFKKRTGAIGVKPPLPKDRPHYEDVLPTLGPVPPPRKHKRQPAACAPPTSSPATTAPPLPPPNISKMIEISPPTRVTVNGVQVPIYVRCDD